jgi:hypothetical protein
MSSQHLTKQSESDFLAYLCPMVPIPAHAAVRPSSSSPRGAPHPSRHVLPPPLVRSPNCSASRRAGRHKRRTTVGPTASTDEGPWYHTPWPWSGLTDGSSVASTAIWITAGRSEVGSFGHATPGGHPSRWNYWATDCTECRDSVRSPSPFGRALLLNLRRATVYDTDNRVHACTYVASVP